MKVKDLLDAIILNDEDTTFYIRDKEHKTLFRGYIDEIPEELKKATVDMFLVENLRVDIYTK